MEGIPCPICPVLRQRIAELEKRAADLEAKLEAAQRAGKRQAAPFAKGQPSGQPRKPGRRPGKDYGTKAHRQPPAPDQIDEVHEAPLPRVCPDCGGSLDETHIAQQFQVEIPRKPYLFSASDPVERARLQDLYSARRRSHFPQHQVNNPTPADV